MIDINYFANRVKAGRDGDPAAERVRSDDAQLTLTFRGVVYPWHLDHMDHMNVQHYVGMFDQSSWVLMSMLGMDSRYFRDNRRGLAALEQNIQYKSELRAGDLFEIRSAVLEVREKTLRVLHNMYQVSTGALAASMTILGVHLDVEARKSTPLPAGVRGRVEAMLAAAC